MACRVVEGKEKNKGSWKVPDTRKQRRWLPQGCLSKLKWGLGAEVKVSKRCGSHNGGLGAGYLNG